MSLNCRTEQLCRIVQSGKANNDRFVTTKEFIPQYTTVEILGFRSLCKDGPGWWVEGSSDLMTIFGPLKRIPIYDKCLRPIGDPDFDAKTEMLNELKGENHVQR